MNTLKWHNKKYLMDNIVGDINSCNENRAIDILNSNGLKTTDKKYIETFKSDELVKNNKEVKKNLDNLSNLFFIKGSLNRIRHKTDIIHDKFNIENNTLNSIDKDTLNEISKVNTLNMDSEIHEKTNNHSINYKLINAIKGSDLDISKDIDPKQVNLEKILPKNNKSPYKLCVCITGIILIIIFIMITIIFLCF